MKKITLKESEFRLLVENTVRTVLNEVSVRDQVYIDQINKEFPGALDNWNNRTPVDQYYLDLVNNKKEQDKIQRKIDRKNDKAEYDAEFGNAYERRKKANDQLTKNYIDQFVDYLPDEFPTQIKRYMSKNGEDMDATFYFLIGEWLYEYCKLYSDEENFDKVFKFLQKAIISDKYEQYFFSKISQKYGEHVIEW